MTTNKHTLPLPDAAPALRPRRDAVDRMLLGGIACTAVVAGVYTLFAAVVMPRLGRKDDPGFIDAMQTANRIVETPVFLAALIGATALPAAAAWKQQKTAGGGPALRWIVAGGALYTVGLVITLAVHVPLNTSLATRGDADPVGVRAEFEDTWNTLNIVRAALSATAVAALGKAARLRRGARRTLG
ncbi:anthrone oxygenase family protein [Yinghuangia soli]|uniref:DUF1772 domain-containing protein n=1 Tax=Yinghuangia soli TaxID=2908204 RepID=A0AA41U5E1_9ACTN|nr:anthrone oxygenase family protein [Yinghuangia soli]MCF2533941.1 DUF1772 domain-containing protein [Yinghuangia soli]